MSVAFIFGPNTPLIDFDGTIHLYERSAAMRRCVDLASRWTGVGVDLLLRKRDIPDEQSTMRINSVALAAISFGLQDALAEIGVIPMAVGGLSLGEQVSAAATGAIARRDMINILFTASHEPASSAPGQEEAIAFVFVPADQDPSPYYEPRCEGVYLGVTFGKVRSGEGEALMLSGYRSALEEFAARHPKGNVRVRDQHVCCAAYHSPLRARARAGLARMLDEAHIDDPAMPMCSSIVDQPVTTAAGVRELLLRNSVETVRVAKMITQVMSYQPRLVVTIGPAMAKGLFTFPVPVVHVDSLETLAEAADAVAEADAARLAA